MNNPVEDDEALRLACNEFIRSHHMKIREVCLEACRRHYAELLIDRHGFETLLSFAAEYLASCYLNATDAERSNSAAIISRRLPYVAEEARALMDAEAGAYQRPRREIVVRPRRMLERIAPSEAQREALLIVWYYAAGYGPDEPTTIPYRRVEETTGISADEIDRMLMEIGTQEPDWFDTQFGTGLMKRTARRGIPPADSDGQYQSAHIEIPDTDRDDPEGPYGDELRAAASELSSGRAQTAEQALEKLIGPGPAAAFRGCPEWPVLVDRILEMSGTMTAK